MEKGLTIKDIKFLAHELARQTMEWNEPIPDFSTRFPNVLESCLAVPLQRFDKKYLYRGLVAKAAILFYLMIKNHPFQNGNKRVAVVALFLFLYKNKKWMNVSNDTLYRFAVLVAQSPSELKKEVVNLIEGFIQKNIVDYEE
jgi:death-on-curing family protein